ncbi:MAG: energy transducer TonB [Rhodospirillales bacterium]
MTNSTVPAESLGSPSPVSASYLWEVPNKAVSIQISLDVIDRIEREVIDSFKAITKRGSEVGGILLGRIAHAGKRTVFVENYESIPCDYARGPLYLLAEPDKERLREALRRLKSSPLAVVGFFRGNTRKELVLDDDDLALAQEFFSDPNQVFLLVKPFAMKPSTGAFFFWEDGQLQAESYLQFPFRRSELQKMPQSIVQAGGRAADAAPPAPAREDRAPVVFPKREERPAPVFVKREEPRLGPVVVPPKREEPKREEPVVSAPPRQDLPPVRVAAPPPAVSKREEPASPPTPTPPPFVSKKREERPPAVPLTFKREERPSIVPVSKREERPAPVLPKREERPPITPVSLKREEKPAVTPKKEEQPKRDERPAIQPVAKREEVAPPPPPAAEAIKKEEPAAASSTSQATLEPAAAAAVDEAVAIPLPDAPANRGAGRWITVILIVLLAVAAGVYFGLIRGRQAPPAPVDTALNLRVERNAGQLVLTWNRNAPVIANSQKSTLSITDGDHQEDVELDPGTLRSGSIVYSPITNDVSFRLEVNGPDGTPVSESVRALAGRPSPLQNVPPSVSETKTQPAATTPASTPAAPQQQQAATQSSSAAQAQPQATAAQTQAPPVDEEPTPQTRVTAVPPKPFSLAARLRPAEPRELAAPPEIAAGSSPSGIAARLLPGQSTAVPPPPVAPPPPAPKPNIRVGGVVEEAEVLERTSPVYPPIARQARVSGVVRVEAVVGTDGRVLKATALSGPPLLRQAAVEAVQRWRYRPGRLNGQPVQVTTQVDVSFTLNR